MSVPKRSKSRVGRLRVRFTYGRYGLWHLLIYLLLLRPLRPLSALCQREVEKTRSLTIAVAVLALAAAAYGLERQPTAVQMREDFGTEPLYNCYMSYFYYIPCPTASWFWVFNDWQSGQVIGEMFTIGDPSMGRAGSGCPPYMNCDPCGAHVMDQFRVLNLAGYESSYPGWNTVKFDVWCADADGCPVGPSLWSGTTELSIVGWNYVVVNPQVCLSNCYTELQSSIKSYPRFLITATHLGFSPHYPAWGFDNISAPLGRSCAMHEIGCCPVLYPRPQVSYYSTMHSGDYGVAFANCPPQRFLNPGDPTGDVYGCIELAWRVYLRDIYTATEPSTWGNIKSMYR